MSFHHDSFHTTNAVAQKFCQREQLTRTNSRLFVQAAAENMNQAVRAQLAGVRYLIWLNMAVMLAACGTTRAAIRSPALLAARSATASDKNLDFTMRDFPREPVHSAPPSTRNWTNLDTALEASVVAVAAVDLWQTRSFLRYPQYEEANPLLGPRPGGARLYASVGAVLLVHALIAYALPAAWRHAWQISALALETTNDVHNAVLVGGFKLAM
jgi:hypothetical protein